MAITSHAEPNRASPATHYWFSVETPSVFREIKLPTPREDWTRSERRAYSDLEALAERYGTHVHCSLYRRG